MHVLTIIVVLPAILNKLDREKEAKEFLKKCEEKLPRGWGLKETVRRLSIVTFDI